MRVTLQPGQNLLHYRLGEKIGEGGMGVVWKATDTMLDREVAIKFLPEGFAADPDRLARFEREARLLAAMNHPSVATVYGLHEQDGIRFIVMEFVPGESLAERLMRGVLPLDDGLDLARQVADALEAAHDCGVIHRDLKPANIRVNADGTAKVLDFGLAKSVEGAVGGDPSSSPTITSGGTAAGVILGTAAYMSPEQARGKRLDRRTDIWSFGCVLYEMLTGKRCFGGETVSDTLARILEREPDWDLLPRETPPTIRAMLRRCLVKDPRRRLRDVGEMRIAIEDRHAEVVPIAEKPPRGLLPRALPWAIAAVMTVSAAVFGWLALRPASAPAGSTARLAISLPQNHQLALADETSLAISPDGSRVVYAASSPPGSLPRLYLRELDRFEAVAIPGTEGAVGPFFSPDGRWLGYFAEGELNKIAVEGGAPLRICHVGQVVPGASWGEDDTILFADSPASGLFRVPAAGGTPERLTTPARAAGEVSHGWPQRLPDGESVLFTIMGTEGTSIALLSLRTGEWQVLTKGMGGARYLPSGHLIFARFEGLVAVPFDLARHETTGEPVVVLDDVYTIPAMRGTGLAAFDVSNSGILAYVGGGAEAGENRLVWVDRDGRTRPAYGEPGGYEWPRISPDGKKVAVTDRTLDGRTDVCVLDIERDARSRLTLEGNDILPDWTPDGKRITFGSIRGDARVDSVYSKAADGSGDTTQLTTSEYPRFPIDWSPDGGLLAIVEWNPQTMRDIWLLDLEDAGRTRPLITSRYDEFAPIFSPDGRWLAYVSDESGRYEVYVESIPRGKGRWLVSAGGGTEPLWSADERELFYRHGDAVISVSVQSAPTFSVGAPRVLFHRTLKTGIYNTLSYDVTDDGREFLMIERQSEQVPNELHVVLNWDEELRRRVPVKVN
jgi:Tol biopolymer transport system component